jgi:hypothetical protein
MLIAQGDTLWLALASEGAPSMIPTAPRPAGLFELTVLSSGNPVPYTYTADISVLELKASGGVARITHDTQVGALRIEAEGISLRFDGKTSSGVSSLNTPDGPVVSIGGGRYLFSARRGTITFDDTWVLNAFGSVVPVVDIAPAGGIIELVVYELPGDTIIPAPTGSFDSRAAENAAEFSAFDSSIVSAPPQYSKLRDEAVYSLWLNSKKLADGNHCITPNRITSSMAEAHRQALASFAFRDFDSAFELLMSLPESSPPLRGFAVTRMIDDGLLDGVELDMLRKLYHELEATAKWWRDNRTMPGAALSYYAYRFESGHPNPSTFTVGAPVIAPDLNAYLVLLYEALSQLAANLGDNAASDKFALGAKERLDAMLSDLWDGERFFAVNVYSGERESAESQTTYAPLIQNEIPLILGRRLPGDVFDKLARSFGEKLNNPPEGAGRSSDQTLQYAAVLLGLVYAEPLEVLGKYTSLVAGAFKPEWMQYASDPITGAVMLAAVSKAFGMGTRIN